MKFTVDGYEIEIKAKGSGDKRFSKRATMDFLNLVSIWMDEAVKYKNFERRDDNVAFTDAQRETSKRCASYLKAASNDLYDQLDAYGCYDDIR